MKELFAPSSVVVVGASRSPSKVGHVVLKNILESGYGGRVYAVNPHADEVLGLKCYRSVTEIPDSLEQAVIAVPSTSVAEVAEQCGEKGVRCLVVISAGFRETGPEGLKREKELVAICRRYGMRLLGPNCLGLIDAHTPLNASFAASTPKAGGIALVSQSGAIVTALLDWAHRVGVGFSKVVSLGNKADIDEVDLLGALRGDEHTKVVLLYVEEIERGAEFVEAARELSLAKPLVVLRGGTTEAGARAAASHTGALAGDHAVYRAAFRKVGAVEVSGLADLVAASLVLERWRRLSGGIAVVTNAGGPGIIAVDQLVSIGVPLARISRSLAEALKLALPPAASVLNPIDVLGDAGPERYAEALRLLLASEEVGGALVLLTPQAMTKPVETARMIAEIAEKTSFKPVVASFLGGDLVEKARSLLLERGVPCFEWIELAASSLKSLRDYSLAVERARRIAEEAEPSLEVDRELVARELNEAVREGRRVLTEEEALEVARAYGIEAAPARLARTAEEAVEAAERLGYPVALKISSPDVLHKTDVGGVRLGLSSPEEVVRGFNELVERTTRLAPAARVRGVLVQKMLARGREAAVGATLDERFGHLIMFGSGGVYVELLRDVSFALAPLKRSEALELVESTRLGTLLRGYRGEPPGDIECAVEVLLRVSRLVTDFKRSIYEIDINPLFVYEKGCATPDVKIIVGRSHGG
ncbi:MAG: acetate--CoA ligase family protein [Fervidicoccaceae archaeon]